MAYKQEITRTEQEINDLIRSLIEGKENLGKDYLDRLDVLIKKYKQEKR